MTNEQPLTEERNIFDCPPYLEKVDFPDGCRVRAVKNIFFGDASAPGVKKGDEGKMCPSKRAYPFVKFDTYGYAFGVWPGEIERIDNDQ